MRGADALAQALDLLANHRGISHDRRLGDHARVMQVEDARAAARAPVLGAVARVLARRAPSQQALSQKSFLTRTADPRAPYSQQPAAPWACPEPNAAAAPLGPAARSRVRGANSLAQALDLLANPHRIVDDRRLGDQTRVV